MLTFTLGPGIIVIAHTHRNVSSEVCPLNIFLVDRLEQLRSISAFLSNLKKKKYLNHNMFNDLNWNAWEHCKAAIEHCGLWNFSSIEKQKAWWCLMWGICQDKYCIIAKQGKK